MRWTDYCGPNQLLLQAPPQAPNRTLRMKDDRIPTAIYLTGHGSKVNPRLIELQYHRIMRYQRAFMNQFDSKQKPPAVYLDLHLPKFGMGQYDLDDAPGFTTLLHAVRNKIFKIIYTDVDDTPNRTPDHESDFVRDLRGGWHQHQSVCGHGGSGKAICFAGRRVFCRSQSARRFQSFRQNQETPRRKATPFRRRNAKVAAPGEAYRSHHRRNSLLRRNRFCPQFFVCNLSFDLGP